MLFVRQNRLHRGDALQDSNWRERGGFSGTGQQQVLCWRWLEQSIVRRTQRRLRPRNVVSDSQARANRLIADQELIVVITNPNVQRKVFESSETILHVGAQRPAGFRLIEDERVRRIEIIYRIRKDISFLILELRKR